MEPRQITVSLRRDPREIAEKHSQANPLTLRCELARGEAVTEELNLYAELHASRTPASSPLASAGPVAMAAAGEGPWELDFSAAQMNQTVLPGEDREFWLVVYATGANDLLLTLGTIRLTLAYDNISQVTPAPPEPALITSFRTIAVAGQSSIVADSSADTLTIAAGNGIVLTTDATTDTLTITAAGGAGSGDVTGPNGATDNAIARFDGTTGKIIQNSTATLSDAGSLAVTDATVSGTLTAPHIHGNLAGAVYSHVRNESGGPLAKGTPVYVTGYSVGQTRSLVAAANAASSATMPAIGILDEDLANNANGHCVISGVITDLNTAAYSVNAPLYVASGGGLTVTAPSVRAQPIAIVERVNANNGSIIVTPATTVGSLASQSAESVAITGGSISGITDLAIADGGTGASTAAVALSNLGGYPASNPNGYTSNAGTVTNVTGTAPISVANGSTTPAITVATFGTSNSGVVPASGGGTTNFLRADGSWAVPPGGTGGAPADADYLVRTANGSLSAERVVGDSTTVTANWTTAGQVSFERAALTGDVTASANSNTTTIANDAVTYAKIQNVSASRLLGRASGTSGDIEEITLGTNLSFSGTTLNATGGSGASVTVSDTPPGTPAAGDLWWNSADGNLYLWYVDGTSNQWVSAAYIPTGGGAGGGGTGTVTSVSVVSANGISGSVANASTTPEITLTLGAITPTSVNGVAISGSSTPTLAVTGTTSVSGSNTGDQTITLSGAVTGSGTGEITTTLSDGAVTETKIANNAVTANKIAAGAVTYSKIQNVIGNAVLANNSGSSGSVQEVTLAASQLLGRGATGNIAPIGLGSGLSMSGTTLSATSASATVDVKRYTASDTWTNPSPSSPRLVLVRLFGGGGSGGSGRASATGDRYGGGGGGAGGMVEIFLMSDRLGATESVTVGAGGASAAGVNATSEGNPGNAGGDTLFGPLRARGGLAGGAGTATTGAGAGAQANIGFGLNNGNLSATVAASSSITAVGSMAARTTIFPCAGGAGGGINGTSGTGYGGGFGEGMQLGAANVYTADRSLGGATGAAGGSGETGAQNNAPFFAGAGGGGGGAGTTTTGGAGGAGGFPGGGGGGGGAGTTASGAGGAGGGGYVEIITYL